jgi:predicted PhzF superfamily epimerase YddE/YHI9
MPALHVLRVFTAPDGSHGNPLGVFLDGGAIAPGERQPVAAELGFSETAFVDDRETGSMRIFTPGTELEFAGHPTIGAAWLLRETGTPVEALRPPAGDEVGAAWAWEDEAAGRVRTRVFAIAYGIFEDEATGAAAVRLGALLGRPLEIRQGRGSIIHARPLGDGRVEISGRVALDELRDYRSGGGTSSK